MLKISCRNLTRFKYNVIFIFIVSLFIAAFVSIDSSLAGINKILALKLLKQYGSGQYLYVIPNVNSMKNVPKILEKLEKISGIKSTVAHIMPTKIENYSVSLKIYSGNLKMCVIDKSLSKKLNLSLGENISIKVGAQEIKTKITNYSSQKGAISDITITWDLGNITTKFTVIEIEVITGQIDKKQQEIERIINHPVFRSVGLHYFFENTIFKIKKGLTLLLSATFCTAFVGICFLTYQNIMERKKEVYLLNAIGAHPFKIVSMFFIEHLILGCFGTIFGITFGIVFSSLIRSSISLISRSEIIEFSPIFTPTSFILAIIIGVFFTIISTFIPLIKLHSDLSNRRKFTIL